MSDTFLNNIVYPVVGVGKLLMRGCREPLVGRLYPFQTYESNQPDGSGYGCRSYWTTTYGCRRCRKPTRPAANGCGGSFWKAALAENSPSFGTIWQKAISHLNASNWVGPFAFSVLTRWYTGQKEAETTGAPRERIFWFFDNSGSKPLPALNTNSLPGGAKSIGHYLG